MPLDRSIPPVLLEAVESFADPSFAENEIVDKSPSTTPSIVIEELDPEEFGEKYMTVLLSIAEDETSTPLAVSNEEEAKDDSAPDPLRTIESLLASNPVIVTSLSRPTTLVPSKLTSNVNTSAAEVAA